MNIAEMFYAGDRGMIEGMVARGQEEHLQLDFKRVADANMTRDDRKTLAICVGGFANASGGVIIWGVDARENAQKIDCAVDLALIDPVGLLLTRLNEFTGQCVSPIVDGVLHRAIAFDGDKGCIVSFIPESASTPHMSKQGENRYYKRSGDSFRCMEHFDLEDMFGRRQKPDLHLQAVRATEVDGSEKITFTVQNTGRAIARYSGVFIEFPLWVNLQQVNPPLLNISYLNNGRPIVTWEHNTSVIHPNKNRNFIGEVIIERPLTSAPLTITAKIYCDKMMMKECDIAL